MDLPKLNDTATRHLDFCLSISTKLIHILTSILTTNGPQRNDNLVLSVGSGSGLLEAHLLKHLTSLPECTSTFTIQGLEVRSPPTAAPVNKYLPEQHSATVRGTWERSPLIDVADTLLFVYPREPDLVTRYLAARSASLRIVLWLGPCADWEVFGGCFQGLEGFGDVEIIEGGSAGVAEFEMIAVVRSR
ncbi:hypothetical protein LA080_011353 [Diaporthe eres]|uniref:Uncharacterized protein n=1 Tax=Diaporthe vaccinii TaxID=105482 RepID=A0ABR4DVB7_9PEZI|nr:hypothetical protein LA080_011353 [Diaporthe eres]